MKRMTAVLSAAAVVLATSFVFAQAKPSFAGKWVREAPAAPAAPAAGAPAPGAGQGGGGGRGGGRGGGGFGQEVTITQDANTITLEWMGGGQAPTAQKRVYKLDGTDSVNNVVGRGGEAAPQTSKAVWEGSKLVITTTTPFGEQKQALSLNGGNLNVDQTAAGRDGGAPTTTTIVYKKAP
jgi:hypothetical protein